MKDGGREIWQMDEADSYTGTVTCMRGIGFRIRLMVTEFIYIMMGRSMKGSGDMISKRGRELKIGRMGPSILGTI